MNKPLYPGAMTPAELIRRELAKAACVAVIAATVAAFATMFLILG